jgi:hypothetical protein
LAKSWEAPFEGETEQERRSERAHQDREIVYFLQQPETHAFRLYHDYTESRPGVDKYFNVVRAGSQVSDPSAYVLDTGEKLMTKMPGPADPRSVLYITSSGLKIVERHFDCTNQYSAKPNSAQKTPKTPASVGNQRAVRQGLGRS